MDVHTLSCPRCGRSIRPEALTCGSCGTSTSPTPGTASIAQSIDDSTASGLEQPSPSGIRKTAPNLPRPPANNGLHPAQRSDEIGRLGGYRILSLLGSGGMGAVYRAEDPRLQRPVALKVVLAHLAKDPVTKARFLREAQAIAKVNHDHIVPIYQVGEDGGLPFLAMPLLKGQPLSVHLRGKGALPLVEVVRIGREIADGLAAAHAVGLLHRDVKPANVWLEGPRRRVRILDFGLVRETGRAESPQAALTAKGALIGTPAYMSPEQAQSQVVDLRSDLWSLGVVLYQLATGHVPFREPTPIATLVAITTDDPVPPNDENPLVPAALNELILQLLKRKPAERPASADEVVRRLADIEVGLTVVSLDDPPVPTPDENVFSSLSDGELSALDDRQPARKSIWQRILAGVVLVGVVIGTWFLASQYLLGPAPTGTLDIDCSDPGAEIVVRRNGEVAVDRTLRRHFQLPVGAYAIELANKKDVLRLSPDKFEVRKDARTVVRIRADQSRQAPNEATPADDADRRFARWVLSHQGKVELKHGGPIASADKLPAGPIKIAAAQLIDLSEAEVARALELLKDVTSAESLQFVTCAVTDEQVERLTQFTFVRTVFQLAFDRCPKLTGRAFVACRTGAGPTDVTFNGTRITVLELQHFVDSPKPQPPLVVRLGSGGVTNEHLAQLAKLKLQVLGLGAEPALTDVGLAHLASLTSLVQLGVWGTAITDAGLDHIVKLTKLGLLNLALNKGLTDAGAAKLATLPGPLELHLNGTNLTDLALDHLAKSRGLIALNLAETKVTKAGIDKFAAAQPRCRVIWSGGIVEPAKR